MKSKLTQNQKIEQKLKFRSETSPHLFQLQSQPQYLTSTQQQLPILQQLHGIASPIRISTTTHSYSRRRDSKSSSNFHVKSNSTSAYCTDRYEAHKIGSAISRVDLRAESKNFVEKKLKSNRVISYEPEGLSVGGKYIEEVNENTLRSFTPLASSSTYSEYDEESEDKLRNPFIKKPVSHMSDRFHKTAVDNVWKALSTDFSQKYSGINKKNEVLSEQRQGITQSINLGSKDLEEKFKQLVTLFKMMNEDLMQRFVLMPDSEGTYLERLIEIEKNVYKLVTLFRKELDLNINRQAETEKKHEEAMKEMKELCEKQKNERLSWYKMFEDNLKKDDKFEESPQARNMLLKNVKLEAELNTLAKKLEEAEKIYDFGVIREEFNRLKSSSQEKITFLAQAVEQRERILAVNRMTQNNYKSSLGKAEIELRAAFEKNNSLKANITQLEKEISALKQRNNQLFETCLMQKEECDTYMIKIKDLKIIVDRIKERMSNLEQKLSRLTKDATENRTNPEEEFFDSDIETLKVIRNQFCKAGNLIKRLESDIREGVGFELLEYLEKLNKIQRSLGVQSEIGEEQETFDKRDVQIYKFSYFRPGFFIFLEDRYPVYKKEVSTLFKSNKLNPLFLAQLRGILDSKFNEFRLCDDLKSLSLFADFLYSWLGKFAVSPVTRKVALLDPTSYSHVDDVRIKFVEELYNQRYDKLWECINFREFLQEKSSQDELYFYLRCRYLLFHGQQLELLESTFEIIHYIKLERAERLIDLVFNKYDSASLLFLRNKFREKAKKKSQKVRLIDTAFVLRVCLEYFKVERLQRLKIIRELFLSHSTKDQSGRVTLSFEAFKSIFDYNFGMVSDLERASIYRECFCVGQGVVTPEVFFAVCTENNFFLKILKVNCGLDFPLHLEKGGNVFGESDFNLCCTMMIDSVEQLYKNFNYFESKIVSLGNEKFSSELWASLKLLKTKLQISPNEFIDVQIYDFYHKVIQRFAKAITLNCDSKILKRELRLDDVVKYQRGHFKDFEELMLRLKDVEKIKGMEFHNKVRHLQRFIRSKVTGWYKLMRNIFDKKLKKDLKKRTMSVIDNN